MRCALHTYKTQINNITITQKFKTVVKITIQSDNERMFALTYLLRCNNNIRMHTDQGIWVSVTWNQTPKSKKLTGH
jgi:hypothetical protein